MQRHAPLPGEVCRVAGTAEQPLHLARPAFLLDLDQGLQLSKVMGVAQRMVHALHREVRLPVVVHDDAGDAIEQAAAPGRDPVEGQPGTRGDVQPLGPPADPQAGLVHVLDRRRFHQSRITSTTPSKRRARLRPIRATVAGTRATANRSAINSARRSSGKSW